MENMHKIQYYKLYNLKFKSAKLQWLYGCLNNLTYYLTTVLRSFTHGNQFSHDIKYSKN